MGSMAVGIRNGYLDDFGTALWVKLHTGDPGAAGTSNAAGETNRVQATMAAASGGASTNSNDLEWPAYDVDETITHVSFWSASSGGTFKGSDDIAAADMDASGTMTLRIPAGDLDVTLT